MIHVYQRLFVLVWYRVPRVHSKQTYRRLYETMLKLLKRNTSLHANPQLQWVNHSEQSPLIKGLNLSDMFYPLSLSAIWHRYRYMYYLVQYVVFMSYNLESIYDLEQNQNTFFLTVPWAEYILFLRIV